MIQDIRSQYIKKSIDDLKKQNVDKRILSSLKCILEEITSQQIISIPCFPIVLRDHECVSLDWPDSNLFCCIFNDCIVIDKTCIIEGRGEVTHSETEIKPNEIKNLFIHKLKELL